MKLFKRALSLSLALQVGIGSTAAVYSRTAYAGNSADQYESSTQKFEQKPYDDIAQMALDASYDQAPTQKVDTFHLTNQVLTLYGKNGEVSQEFDLSRPDLALPEIAVGDFDRDVQATTDAEGSLVLIYTKKKKTVATHTFKDIKPVTISRDKELLLIVDRNGRLQGLDVGYARLRAFVSPVPLFDLGKSGLKRSELKKVKSRFLIRMTPYMKRSNDPAHIFPVDSQTSSDYEALAAGDLLLYTESNSGEPTLVGQFDRDVIRTQIYTGEAVLSMLAFTVAPPDDAHKVAGTMASLVNEIKSQNLSLIEQTRLSSSEREALTSLSFERLVARARANKADHVRDRFTRSEWLDSSIRLLEQAKVVEGKGPIEREIRQAAERGELGIEIQEALLKRSQKASLAELADPRPTWYRLLSSAAVRKLALVAAGTAALGGVAAHSAWGIQLTNALYAHYWPEVLKDTVYRVTLLKSSLALGAFVPLTYLLGMIVASKTGWKPVKALASQTIKMFAALSLPFYHRLSALTRQPNLMRALAQGLSPTTQVKADSALGRELRLDSDVRPALNNPLLSSSDQKKVELDNAKILTALSQQNTRIKSLAWFMALQTASAEAGIDPTTATLLMSEEGEAFAKAKLDGVTNDKNFQALWTKLAMELEVEFKKIGRNEYIEEFSQIKVDDLNMYLGVARARLKEIKSRDLGGKFFASMKLRWLRFGQGAAKAIATFGKKENELLNTIVPNDFVVSQFWKSYVVDYWLAVAQMGVIGERAVLNDPQALAAREGSFLWTNPGHRFDMVDQIRAYLLSFPAGLVLAFQDPSQVKETAYDPVETISLQGPDRGETFRQGFKTWLKLAFDPTRADDYGRIAVRGFVRGLKTIQFGMMMALIGRVVVGGQEVAVALSAYVFWTLWAKWGYGFPWDPIQIGNERYETATTERRADFLDAKRKIGQGLRMDDEKLLSEGYEALAKMYAKAGADSQVSRMLSDVEAALSQIREGELATLRQEQRPYLEAVVELRRAIEQGRPSRLRAARLKLEKVYETQGLGANRAARAQLSSISLLDYALKSPPFVTKSNGLITWTTTLVGAVLTTYLATSMAVLTFRPDVDWTKLLAETAVKSAALYTSYFYVTKLIANYTRKRQEEKAAASNATAPSSAKPNLCSGAFGAVPAM